MMTRWMFFLLLGLNLAVFLWPQPSRSPGETYPSGANPIPSLKLTSELVIPMVNPVRQGDRPPPHNQREPDPGAASIPDQVAKVDTDSPGNQPPTAEPVPHKETIPTKEDVDLPPAPGALAVSSAEAPSSPTSSVQESEVPLSVVQTAEVSHPVCQTLGPLSNRPTLGDLGKELGAQGGRISLRQVTNKVETGYWVIIPPRPSVSAANEMVETLRAAGISDVMRFPKGELANAVSVGVFSGKPQAEQHRKNMAAKGFNVEIMPRFAEKSQFWVDVVLPGGQPLQDNWRRALTVKFPGKRLGDRPCE